MNDYSAKTAYRGNDTPIRYLMRRHYKGWLGKYRLTREKSAVRSMLKQLPNGIVGLDCPCGNGRWFGELVGKCHTIIAMDASASMVRHAQGVAAGLKAKFRFLTGDAERIELADRSLDMVFSFALMKHLPPLIQQKVLREFARVARNAVICSFALGGPFRQRLLKPLRRAESFPLTMRELHDLAGSAGLKIIQSRSCATPVGLERLIFFTKSEGAESLSADYGGMSGVTVAYSGVHQAFQLALAAQELGCLDRFFCSVFDAPGKWGTLLSRWIGEQELISRRCETLDPTKVEEHPLPLVARRMAQATGFMRQRFGLLEANRWFDRIVANNLAKSKSQLFVGVETCAEYSLAVARERAMVTILDHPSVGADFLNSCARQAAEKLGLKPPKPSDSPELSARKKRELALADHVIVCSHLTRRQLQSQGVPGDKVSVVPLWADTDSWRPPPTPEPVNTSALRVLYVGAISIRKGIPYLLAAARRLGSEVDLTLVGTLPDDARPFLAPHEGSYRLLCPRPRAALQELYWRADVFVLPSLGDSWGFVALEAMLSGLPVIVTQNCGAPVPHESWRVPVMNTEAIVERLLLYARNRALCREHGNLAAEFAKQFTLRRYRANVQTIFRRVLG